jgi:hypothetical protein
MAEQDQQESINRRTVGTTGLQPNTYTPEARYDSSAESFPVEDRRTSSVYAPEIPRQQPYEIYSPGNSSESTRRRDGYSYQPYVAPPIDAIEQPQQGFTLKSEPSYRRISSNPDDPNGQGREIQPTWRRNLLTWVLALFAVVLFVSTSLFAANATRGANADTRFLFSNPGRTILVLQILTNITTTLFGELLIASCELVSSLTAISHNSFDGH